MTINQQKHHIQVKNGWLRLCLTCFLTLSALAVAGCTEESSSNDNTQLDSEATRPYRTESFDESILEAQQKDIFAFELQKAAGFVPEVVFETVLKDYKDWIHESSFHLKNQLRKNGNTNVRLAAPYEMWRLEEQDGELELLPRYGWLFPVVVNGRYVSLLRVNMHRNLWKIISHGSGAGAKKIQQAEESFGDDVSVYKRAVVVSKLAQQEFIVYADPDQEIRDGLVFFGTLVEHKWKLESTTLAAQSRQILTRIMEVKDGKSDPQAAK